MCVRTAPARALPALAARTAGGGRDFAGALALGIGALIGASARAVPGVPPQPVASQNTKDFYNLVNVYLDAVLHPRAKRDPTVLAQEGWHYELEDVEAPLTYKGVVFNEMKGVYSSPDSLMYRAAQQLTFPDNTYAVDSGGDPRAIPSLTFEQFKAFHDAYYHPANSRIFFYGDDDLLTRLELLDEYLRDFDATDATPQASEVGTQSLIPTPRRKVESYPVAADEAEPTHMVTSAPPPPHPAPVTSRTPLRHSARRLAAPPPPAASSCPSPAPFAPPGRPGAGSARVLWRAGGDGRIWM